MTRNLKCPKDSNLLVWRDKQINETPKWYIQTSLSLVSLNKPDEQDQRRQSIPGDAISHFPQEGFKRNFHSKIIWKILDMKIITYGKVQICHWGTNNLQHTSVFVLTLRGRRRKVSSARVTAKILNCVRTKFTRSTKYLNVMIQTLRWSYVHVNLNQHDFSSVVKQFIS